MKHKVRIGVIGWIDPSGPWPMPAGNENWQIAGQAGLGHPGANWWIIKSYLGLMATTNSTPPPWLPNFHAYQAKKDFRAMVWANLEFDDAPGSGPVHAAYVGSEPQSRIVDPGYTPPVNFSRVGAMGMLAKTLIKREEANDKVNVVVDAGRDIRDNCRRFFGLPPQPRGGPVELPYGPLGGPHTLENIESRHAYRGEISPVSAIHRDKMHNNSVFPALPPGERLIANAVMRFRAGPHTDRVGMTDATSEYHVPWVWAEFLLTSLGGGRVRLRGASSIFPTVAWYLNDVQVAKPHQQVGDLSLPQPFGVVDPFALRIYPVLSAGAPKTMPEPPASLDVKFGEHRTPITSMPWTCPGKPWVDVDKTLHSAA